MIKYLYLGDFRLPTYSIMIAIGLLVCNLIALYFIKQNSLNLHIFLRIEFWGGCGAIIGARLFSFMLNVISGEQTLSWHGFRDSGFAYFGGLFGFLFGAWLFLRIKHIDCTRYTAELFFLIPLLHGFWKIGCFFAGCCGGISFCIHGTIFFHIQLGSITVSTLETFYVNRLLSPNPFISNRIWHYKIYLGDITNALAPYADVYYIIICCDICYFWDLSA